MKQTIRSRGPQPARKNPVKKAGAAKPKKQRPAKLEASPPRVGRNAPRVITENLKWRGVDLLIMYKSHAFAAVGDAGGTTAHLEVRSMGAADLPLPITDTGYRSHFLPRGEVEKAGGPGLYVRRWLEQEATSASYKRTLDRWRQLDLFA
jgi:hypothetical protein